MAINFNRAPSYGATPAHNSYESLSSDERSRKRGIGGKVLGIIRREQSSQPESTGDRLTRQLEEMKKRNREYTNAANSAASTLDDYTARLLNQMSKK